MMVVLTVLTLLEILRIQTVSVSYFLREEDATVNSQGLVETGCIEMHPPAVLVGGGDGGL